MPKSVLTILGVLVYLTFISPGVIVHYYLILQMTKQRHGWAAN